MNEPYWWYVLFVRSNTEHRVIKDFTEFIKTSVLAYEFDLFSPESERYYRTKVKKLGKRYVKRPLFPGYVFIETNMPSEEFIKNFAQYFYGSADIIRLLKYGDSKEIAISTEERQRFEFLFKGKRCLEHSIGYMDGDRVIITAGPLIGMEGCIQKINRHNRSAKIEIEMFGQKQTVDVSLEIFYRK